METIFSLCYPTHKMCYLKKFSNWEELFNCIICKYQQLRRGSRFTAARIMIGNSNCYPKNCITIILLLIMQMYWVVHFELKVYKFLFGKYFWKIKFYRTWNLLLNKNAMSISSGTNSRPRGSSPDSFKLSETLVELWIIK